MPGEGITRRGLQAAVALRAAGRIAGHLEVMESEGVVVMSSEVFRRRPEIVTTVRAKPGAYRQRVDMTGPGSESEVLPDVAAGGRVKVQVGLGIRGEDLPQLVATARQVRHVAVVEVIGQTRKAVEDARTLFTTAWDILDKQAAPGGAEEAAKLWAALLLAVRGGEASGAAFWDGRSFGPFNGGGER